MKDPLETCPSKISGLSFPECSRMTLGRIGSRAFPVCRNLSARPTSGIQATVVSLGWSRKSPHTKPLKRVSQEAPGPGPRLESSDTVERSSKSTRVATWKPFFLTEDSQHCNQEMSLSFQGILGRVRSVQWHLKKKRERVKKNQDPCGRYRSLVSSYSTFLQVLRIL